jgi:ferredoxin-type protein NapH
MNKYLYLTLRRVTQIGILALYISANLYGIEILVGNLSSSTLFGFIPLSDPFAVLQMLAAGAILGFDVLLGAAIIFGFYALFGGRLFCSWVCPINMVTDLANWLRRVLHLDAIERKVWLSRNVRYWIIALVLILSFFNGVAAFEFVSPIAMFHRGAVFGMGMGFAAILSIFLFDLFAVKNGWCGHICPLGGFYSLTSKYSLFRVKHDHDKCTLCLKCKDVCPEKQVLHMIGKSSVSVLDGECVNCLRCIEVCDDDALSFGVRKFINDKKQIGD